MTTSNPHQISLDDIEQAYGFHQIDDATKRQADVIRGIFKDVAQKVTLEVPSNRARSLALTNLQQAKMWAVQAVVDGPAQ